MAVTRLSNYQIGQWLIKQKQPRDHKGRYAVKRKTKRGGIRKFVTLVVATFMVSFYGWAYASTIEGETIVVEQVTPLEVGIITTKKEQEPKEWTRDEIIQLIRDTFPETPGLAVAIAKAESGENLKATAYNPEAHKGCIGSYGVFQIACVHEDNIEKLYDVEYNIQRAREIYDSEGWSAWGGYTSGGFKKYI